VALQLMPGRALYGHEKLPFSGLGRSLAKHTALAQITNSRSCANWLQNAGRESPGAHELDSLAQRAQLSRHSAFIAARFRLYKGLLSTMHSHRFSQFSGVSDWAS
jgi:hypothetical protein